MKTINLSVTDSKSEAPKSRNWIFVLDFSGSMGWTLEPLCENVMTEIRRVPIGDTITIAWFSGVGYNGFIVKGTEVTGDRTHDIIETAVRNNLYTRNTTCFSEILAEMQQVVIDLTPFSEVFNLLFFTDGCPVVPSVQAEIIAIKNAIWEVAHRLSSVLFIGYGNYYNRELMSDMAQWAGGALVHSRDLYAVQSELGLFMNGGAKSASKVTVNVSGDPKLVFFVHGDNVATVSVGEGKVSVPSGAKLYVLSDEGDGDDSPDARYATAAALAKAGMTGDAMDVLGELGDKALIDILDSAYTLDDIGKAEDVIRDAAIDPLMRYLEGKVENYVPDPNAFCLLDAIEVLVNDDTAKFYPQDKAFRYQRIGAKTKREKKYPAFHPDNTGCRMNSLTWNKSKLNLSVLARTDGHILLGKSAASHRLPEVFGTYKWNNYALVKDGACNVPVLPASFSEDTYEVLYTAGMMSTQWVGEGHVYLVHLDKVPVMNRAIAEGYKSGEALAKLVLEGHRLRARQKVLGYYYDLAYGEDAPEIEGYTPEQSEYLTSKGIDRRGGYSPKVEKAPVTDFYLSKTFEVKVKGLSSLPKVQSVIDRVENDKKQTTSGKLILRALDWYTSCLWGDEPLSKERFDNERHSIRAEIKSLDSEIARAKFSVLLGKSWFDDVPRDNPVIDVDGYVVTFAIGEKKVEF